MDIETNIILKNDRDRNLLHTMLMEVEAFQNLNSTTWEEDEKRFWEQLVQATKPNYCIDVKLEGRSSTTSFDDSGEPIHTTYSSKTFFHP